MNISIYLYSTVRRTDFSERQTNRSKVGNSLALQNEIIPVVEGEEKMSGKDQL
jgi:hypothetical protein